MQPEHKRTVDKEMGSIFYGDRRVVELYASNLQTLVNKLLGLAGARVAEVLLVHMGGDMGREAYASRKQIREAPLDELRSISDQVVADHGWGRYRELNKESRNGKEVYSVAISDCPLCYKRTAMEPVCHLMRGIVMGWIESYVDRKSHNTAEVQCSAMGSPNCKFEITFEG